MNIYNLKINKLLHIYLIYIYIYIIMNFKKHLWPYLINDFYFKLFFIIDERNYSYIYGYYYENLYYYYY